jgi:hypothetical protein
MKHEHQNPESDIAIRVQRLAKRFGDVQAVTAVDIEVHEGELFGFLGWRVLTREPFTSEASTAPKGRERPSI